MLLYRFHKSDQFPQQELKLFCFALISKLKKEIDKKFIWKSKTGRNNKKYSLEDKQLEGKLGSC